jgi:SagB-type dehydrogenase family enzyme
MLFAFCCIVVAVFCADHDTKPQSTTWTGAVPLALPNLAGEISVAQAIYRRTSVRDFARDSLSFGAVSQLLWAAAGKTADGVTGASRAYPSAGGLYPLEIYLVSAGVDSLAPGVYHYMWESHSLVGTASGDHMDALKRATHSGAFSASYVPACIVITARYSRTTSKYGTRGERRYVPMDAGGSAQNVHLQAQALGIATYPIGAFRDAEVQKVLGIEDTQQTPLLIIPCGRSQ